MSREELVNLCKSGCERAGQTCQVDVGECKSECEEIPDPASHPCGNEIRAVAQCSSTNEVKCTEQGFTVEGCEAELASLLACVEALNGSKEEDVDGQDDSSDVETPSEGD